MVLIGIASLVISKLTRGESTYILYWTCINKIEVRIRYRLLGDGLYVISVAARLLEMHPQTLRKYERVGLVMPTRTVGMLRLYSEEDIVRLRLIKHLIGDLGLNLSGVELALGMFNQMLKMQSTLNQLENNDVKIYLEDCLDKMFEMLMID